MKNWNYMSMLLILILVIQTYDTIMLVLQLAKANSSKVWATDVEGWEKGMVIVSPFLLFMTFGLGARQVQQHVMCIQEESAVLRHDRAVQIIALPIVYSAMCMSCLAQCCQVLISDKDPTKDTSVPIEVATGGVALWIADLYEAWSLYQFGVLALELLESSFLRQMRSPDQETKLTAKGLLAAHSAIGSLAWLGILSFVLVSASVAAVGGFFLTIGRGVEDYEERFHAAVNAFNVAGFFASATAIFNVFVVERNFGHHLEEFYPFLKFLTVKILVSFAYFQKYAFFFLQVVNGMAPKHIRDSIHNIPVVGKVMEMNDTQFYMFYSCLLIIECFVVAIMHMWAWGHNEKWYEDDGETKILQPGEALVYGSRGHSGV